MRSCQV